MGMYGDLVEDMARQALAPFREGAVAFEMAAEQPPQFQGAAARLYRAVLDDGTRAYLVASDYPAIVSSLSLSEFDRRIGLSTDAQANKIATFVVRDDRLQAFFFDTLKGVPVDAPGLREVVDAVVKAGRDANGRPFSVGPFPEPGPGP